MVLQDANALTMTTAEVTADLVAVRSTWIAETPPQVALAAKLGGPKIAIKARANHGRWIVECPDCCMAQLAAPADHRFMCNGCANAAVDGLWRPVIWPENRQELDQVLILRPEPNRNWTPGEAVEDLLAENEEAGL